MTEQEIRDRLHQRVEQFVRDLRENPQVPAKTPDQIDRAFGAFLYVVKPNANCR